MKKKGIVQTEEQRIAGVLAGQIRDIERHILNGAIPKNPTRLFNIGDFVKIGNLKNITVTEVLFDGLAYKIHYDYTGQAYGQPVRQIGDGIWAWVDIYPVGSFPKTERLSIVDDVRINYYNNTIDSLLSKVYHSGVDFNPDYQRDLVWTEAQKFSLLDSIFNNIEIGKFTFIKHDYSRELYYEILDGKQRLSTLCEFHEDRLIWKGKKFTQLCIEDKWHFEGFPIIQAEVGELTQQQVYKLFVKMNTSGTPISQEHLDRIKSLIK